MAADPDRAAWVLAISRGRDPTDEDVFLGSKLEARFFIEMHALVGALKKVTSKR